MSMIDVLKKTIKKYPHMRALIRPIWIALRNRIWDIKKVLQIPVVYSAGLGRVRLYPNGQIPEMLFKGNFEAVERDFVASFLRSGMNVLNIGANVGLYTIMAAELIKPSGIVYAFEPSSESFTRLQKNLELNGCQNVIVNKAALSNVSGQLLLRVDSKNPTCDGHRYVETPEDANRALSSDELVESMTLDCYLAEQNYPLIDLIIMDVEGAEKLVLEGGMKTFARLNSTILLECSKNQLEVERILNDLGYRFWRWNVIEKKLESVDFKDAALLGDVVARREAWRFLP
ncbi:FkbM family methyltransferase [Polynucleobacter sinensis]|uniref:FkbM family methyltransferase n=1 Tax=Polynucleobacter sinensis TaxID=1743157 RepID=UPI0007819BF3|nr:FkbM family methyltransferase [Polynucleobacter sinensis]